MKNLIRHLVLALICINIILCRAQNAEPLNKLKKVLTIAKHDTTRINVLYLISVNFQNSDYDSTMRYARRVLELSKINNYQRGFAQGFHMIGIMKDRIGEYDSAMHYLNQALKINEAAGRKIDMAASIDGIAQVFQHKSNFPKSFEFHFMALKIYKEVKDKKGEATTLGNIGIVHYFNNDYKLCLEYYNKALVIDKELGNDEGVARHLGNLANVYLKLGDEFRNKGMKKEADREYKQAFDALFQSFNTAEKLGNKPAMARNISAVGNVYYSQGDTLKAIEYYKKSLKLEEEQRNKEGIARNLCNIGWVYLELKKYKDAEEFTAVSILYADSIKDLYLLYNLYENMSIILEESGQFEFALKNYKKFIILRDSIFNIDNSRKALQSEMNYKFEQKENIAKQEQGKQKIIRNAFISGFALMFILAIVILRGYRAKQKANQLISEQKELVDVKNKEITDSIQYAKRIQNSLLPTEKYIERNLNKLQKD